MNTSLGLESVRTSWRGTFIKAEFGCELFKRFFLFVNFIEGLCSNEDIIYIADINLGHFIMLNIVFSMWYMLNSDIERLRGEHIPITSLSNTPSKIP